jgi:hypothetical protein
MAIEVRDKQFGTQCVNALDNALLGLGEMDRLGVIDPQEAANLSSRFLNLKAQVLRGMGLTVEASVTEHQAVLPWTQPELWELP